MNLNNGVCGPDGCNDYIIQQLTQTNGIGYWDNGVNHGKQVFVMTTTISTGGIFIIGAFVWRYIVSLF